MMGLGSQTFLSGIEALREIRGISPFWTALLLGPIATEAPELLTLTHFLRKRSLPEAFSILWGSIHLQTTLSVAVGILASPWLGSPGAIHAGFALGGLLGLLLLPAILRRSRTSEGDPR
jgi:Ca2+/Na+ antiporter